MRDRSGVALLIIAFAACGDAGGFPDAYVPPDAIDPGTIDFNWSLVDGTGSATTCAAVNAAMVKVTIAEESTGDINGQPFACDLLGGISGPLLPGTYDLAYKLVDGSGATLATGSAQTGVSVSSNMTATTTPVVFTLSM